jgi:hypothetical protein
MEDGIWNLVLDAEEEIKCRELVVLYRCRKLFQRTTCEDKKGLLDFQCLELVRLKREKRAAKKVLRAN